MSNSTGYILAFGAGFILAALVLTTVGREVTGVVARATGERLEYYIKPKR